MRQVNINSSTVPSFFARTDVQRRPYQLLFQHVPDIRAHSLFWNFVPLGPWPRPSLVEGPAPPCGRYWVDWTHLWHCGLKIFSLLHSHYCILYCLVYKHCIWVLSWSNFCFLPVLFYFATCNYPLYITVLLFTSGNLIYRWGVSFSWNITIDYIYFCLQIEAQLILYFILILFQ